MIISCIVSVNCRTYAGANGHLQRFLDMTSDMNPDEIAKFMETDADICSVHEETAMEGSILSQTRGSLE